MCCRLNGHSSSQIWIEALATEKCCEGIYALQRCYAAYGANIPYWSFGTTYWPHHRGSRKPRILFFLEFLTLEDGTDRLYHYSLPTFRNNLSVSSSGVKKSERLWNFSWISWPLKMGPICCPEMCVMNYHYRLYNIPKEGRFHLLRGGSAIPRNCCENYSRCRPWRNGVSNVPITALSRTSE